MTRDELFALAVECATSAKEMADKAYNTSSATTERSVAYSRAGELFLQLAEHQYGMDVLKPRPAPDRDTLAV